MNCESEWSPQTQLQVQRDTDATTDLHWLAVEEEVVSFQLSERKPWQENYIHKKNNKQKKDVESNL